MPMFSKNSKGVFLVALSREDIEILAVLGEHTFEVPTLDQSFHLLFRETTEELKQYLRDEGGKFCNETH